MKVSFISIWSNSFVTPSLYNSTTVLRLLKTRWYKVIFVLNLNEKAAWRSFFFISPILPFTAWPLLTDHCALLHTLFNLDATSHAKDLINISRSILAIQIIHLTRNWSIFQDMPLKIGFRYQTLLHITNQRCNTSSPQIQFNYWSDKDTVLRYFYHRTYRLQSFIHIFEMISIVKR